MFFGKYQQGVDVSRGSIPRRRWNRYSFHL